jgi:pyruvate/2-oxoglutarate dehydrogenase complex dihydrolipoamide acyltransferase (E2) component
MRAEILLPDLQAGPTTLSVWFADLGELVFEGDRLVEVLVGGATFDVPAPATGRLVEKRALTNDRLHPGQVLGAVEATE